jgi:hypothetical protein
MGKKTKENELKRFPASSSHRLVALGNNEATADRMVFGWPSSH